MSVRILAAIAAIACLADCAQQALVVVFPDADGHAGAVTLADGTSEVLLDKPYAAGDSPKVVRTASWICFATSSRHSNRSG